MSQRCWFVIERLLSRWTTRLVVINQTDADSVASWRIAREGRVIKLRGIGIDPGLYARSEAEHSPAVGNASSRGSSSGSRASQSSPLTSDSRCSWTQWRDFPNRWACCSRVTGK